MSVHSPWLHQDDFPIMHNLACAHLPLTLTEDGCSTSTASILSLCGGVYNLRWIKNNLPNDWQSWHAKIPDTLWGHVCYTQTTQPEHTSTKHAGGNVSYWECWNWVALQAPNMLGGPNIFDISHTIAATDRPHDCRCHEHSKVFRPNSSYHMSHHPQLCYYRTTRSNDLNINQSSFRVCRHRLLLFVQCVVQYFCMWQVSYMSRNLLYRSLDAFSTWLIPLFIVIRLHVVARCSWQTTVIAGVSTLVRLLLVCDQWICSCQFQLCVQINVCTSMPCRDFGSSPLNSAAGSFKTLNGSSVILEPLSYCCNFGLCDSCHWWQWWKPRWFTRWCEDAWGKPQPLASSYDDCYQCVLDCAHHWRCVQCVAIAVVVELWVSKSCTWLKHPPRRQWCHHLRSCIRKHWGSVIQWERKEFISNDRRWNGWWFAGLCFCEHNEESEFDDRDCTRRPIGDVEPKSIFMQMCAWAGAHLCLDVGCDIQGSVNGYSQNLDYHWRHQVPLVWTMFWSEQCRAETVSADVFALSSKEEQTVVIVSCGQGSVQLERGGKNWNTECSLASYNQWWTLGGLTLWGQLVAARRASVSIFVQCHCLDTLLRRWLLYISVCVAFFFD